MELIQGYPERLYYKKGKLSVKEATSIAIQVSLGLRRHIRNGIVHSDVKPQNIIISVDGKVKVTDLWYCKSSFFQYHKLKCDGIGSLQFTGTGQRWIQ